MGSRRKILIVSAAFPPIRSGESEHALYLCRHLSACGLDVHVLTGIEGVAMSDEPFTIHRIMRDWKSRDIVRLVGVLRRLRPDAILIIYSAWAYGYHSMITFAPTLIHRLFGRRVVTQFEFVDGKHPQAALDTRSFSLIARSLAGAGADWFYGTLLRDSNQIIVLDNRYRDDLARTQPDIDAKCILVPPPPLLHLVPEKEAQKTRQQKRAEWGVQDTDFVVAFFGYLYPGKGVDILLRAAAQVPNTWIVLIGGELSDYADYALEMQKLAEEMRIADRVLWTGHYSSDSEEPSQCLWAADVCALPFDDGVTVNRSSFAAAAAHNLPIVTTQGKMIDPMFVDGENVLLCPPRDSVALASLLNSLLTSNDLRLHLRSGIHTLAQTWFSWQSATERTLQALSVTAMHQASL